MTPVSYMVSIFTQADSSSMIDTAASSQMPIVSFWLLLVRVSHLPSNLRS